MRSFRCASAAPADGGESREPNLSASISVGREISESLRSAGYGSTFRWIVPLFWLTAAVPSPLAGWVIGAAAGLAPLLIPRTLPLLLVSSYFFYSTMAVPAGGLYAFRAYWLLSYLAWILLALRVRLDREIWLWLAGIGLLLVWGTITALVLHGGGDSGNRTPVFEAAIACLWLLSMVVGWTWLRLQGGALDRADLAAIVATWFVSIGYGVVQGIFGVSDATVPTDVWPQLEGFSQYEAMGRRPFTWPTPNGMAAVSLLPIVLLFGASFRSSIGTAGTAMMAALVGALTLTRSYLVILVALILLLPFLLRTSKGGWVFLVLLGGVGTVLIVQSIDPELLSLALRLEGDITSLRGDIWKFTLENLDVKAWLFGMGFGSAVWSHFFSPLSLDKELQSPHSALLEITGQFGVAGLLVYLAICWTLLRCFIRSRCEPWRAAVSLTALLILVRELVAASYVFSPSVLSAYFWTTFGMALATSHHFGTAVEQRTNRINNGPSH